nr:immunoglobulin light chain junction region [Macaca mulatta]MOW28669.1 immunoglobulin light chain junction region [Macaca mulatta]
DYYCFSADRTANHVF